MNMQYKLLLYLDKRHYLTKMKTTCENYLDNLSEKTKCKFPPLRFVLEIDVMDLMDIFPDLADLLLREPLKLQCFCNDILFICIQSLENENKEHVKRSQVAVTLRLKCAPSAIIRSNAKDYKGLVYFDGLLLSMTKPEGYVYHSVWSCPEECEGNEVILQYIPKVPPRCYICKSILFENSGMRRCGEQVTATFILKGRLLANNFVIVDDLIPKLNLGSKFNIYAVTLKKLTAVWGLEEVIPLPYPLTTPIPENIKDLHRACRSISWKFVYCLASGIGVNVCPLNCFMQLKINLLLSMVSVKAHLITGTSILHVFAAGCDSGYVSEIMQEALKLADRFVCLGPSDCDTSTSLIASFGGVCIMPVSLHNYHQKVISKILCSIEAGKISNYNKDIGLKCAIWAQDTNHKKINLNNITSVFGTICRDFGEQNDELAHFILEKSINNTRISKEEIQALKELMIFIDLVAGIEVVLDQAAEKLLKNYFLAARREQPQGAPIGSMGALVAICTNAARLCLRNVANIDDAVFAIWLHVSGGPEPRFAPAEYLQTPGHVTELKKVMRKFKDWLEVFTRVLEL